MTSAVRLTTDLDADAARMITLDIRDSAEGLLALVVEAYNGRVWIALGYESWDAWKQGELANIELPREAIPSLKAEGLSNRAIATVSGISEATVRRTAASNDAPVRVSGVDGKSYPAHVEPRQLTEAEQIEEDHRLAIRRGIGRLEELVNGWIQLQSLPRHPDREALLTGLTDRDRMTVLEIEAMYLEVTL